MGKLRSSAGVSPRRVAGFACHQGFLYSLFYMGMNREYSIGSFAVERVELLGTLAAMVVTLVVMNVMARRAPSVREVMLERHSVIAYAVALVIGAFVPVVMGSLQTDELVFESIMVGVPWALMLLAWARRLARGTTEKSTVEVFVGAGVGAALCFLVYLVPAPQAQWALKLLAIPSAVLLAVDMRKVDAEAEEARPEASVSTSAATDFSVKVLAGTVCFGLAAGFMEAYNSNPGTAAMASFPASLLLFVLFCAGALQALLASDVRVRGGLDGAYRLALLVMMAGFLFSPVLEGSGVPGGAIVLAGYLGLTSTLVSLFLAFSKIVAEDPARTVARGFLALFGGEAAGVMLANVSNAFALTGTTPYVIVCFAGLATLFAYLFLFTERDFKALSEIARTADYFEEACAVIAKEAGLSKREAEILPLALRGRTSERIAGELFISKSTVDTHLRRIYAKADVHGRQELIDLGEKTAERIASR
ncbi:helix-turn-helix transcriptional regulator [Slackia piriformis]|nr:helix-turn-helix transcriptional regulator [Slackia piriformis]